MNTARSVRAFIAVKPPPEVARVLLDTQDALRARLPEGTVRWTKPESFHLTLAFLGTIDPWQVTEAERVLTEVASPLRSIALETRRLGLFPSSKRPSVLWVGLGGEVARLEALQAALARGLKPSISLEERRAFRPHLTLGRTRPKHPAEARQVGETVMTTPPLEGVSWRAERVSLIRSDLTPQGARYTPLATVEFTGRGP